MEIAKVGYKTVGFDVQEQKVEQVNRAHNYIGDVVDSALGDMVKSGGPSTTSNFFFISSIDCATICVPTPLNRRQQPDISYVKDSTESVAKYSHAGMLVVLESTTYPSTTEEPSKSILGEDGLVCGEDLLLAFSSRRVDPGNKRYRTKNTPKVAGGVGKNDTEVAAVLYRNVLEGGVYEAASPAVAEMEKLLENTYCNINIGSANGMAIICNRMDINVRDVIDATKARPYGFRVFHPNSSLGGHCIPLDPFCPAQKAHEYNYHTRLIETSDEINTTMPEYVADRAVKVLNRNKTVMNGARVLILGTAYKNDIDNYRESPALNVIDHLLEQGADAVFFDPYIPEYKHKGNVHKGLIALTDDESKNADIVIICAAHECFSCNGIQSLSKAVFDTRSAMKNVTDRGNTELP